MVSRSAESKKPFDNGIPVKVPPQAAQTKCNEVEAIAQSEVKYTVMMNDLLASLA